MLRREGIKSKTWSFGDLAIEVHTQFLSSEAESISDQIGGVAEYI